MTSLYWCCRLCGDHEPVVPTAQYVPGDKEPCIVCDGWAVVVAMEDRSATKTTMEYTYD